MEEKVAIHMGSNAVENFAKSLYSLPWLTIWTREIALQNAIDACRNEPKPRVCISIRRMDDKTAEVIVDDNGCGMDRKVFKEAYLGLWESGKKSNSDTGGFGIATAVVLSSKWWEVHTKGLYCDKADMILKDISPRQGTSVTCRNEVWWGDSWKNDSMLIIYTSKVDVELMMSEFNKIILSDPHAGSILDKGKLKLVEEYPQLKVWMTTEDLPMPKEYTGRRNGLNIVRLNGMTQFFYSSPNGRKCNLIFDVTPTVRPTEDGYPFTASREELKGNVREIVRTIINRFEVDQISSVRKIEQPKPRKHMTNGALLHGRRGTRIATYSLADLDISDLNAVFRVMSRMGMGMTASGSSQIYDRLPDEEKEKILEAANVIPPPPQEKTPAILLENFNDRARNKIVNDSHILDLWKDMLMEIAPVEIGGFGIGLTLDTSVYGKCATEGNVTYILINPDKLPTDRRSRVVCMWETACHEIAHFYEDVHNEVFSAQWSSIMRETSGILLNNLKRWS